jgi:hypothetical protein
MKTTFKEIEKFCTENYLDLNKIVALHTMYGSDRDKYQEQFDKFTEKFGIMNVEECDRTSDGDHDESLLVVSLGSDLDKIYFGGSGTYSSYEGEDFSYMVVKEMQPYQKVITDWKSV